MADVEIGYTTQIGDRTSYVFVRELRDGEKFSVGTDGLGGVDQLILWRSEAEALCRALNRHLKMFPIEAPAAEKSDG